MNTTYEKLKDWFRQFDGALVAFSGGVDSSLLLAAAHDALGEKALGVTAQSETYSPEELDRAKKIAAELGARHLVVETSEFENPLFTSNPPDRCYHCKRELLQSLFEIAKKEKLSFVVDGSNADDKNDYRPGSRATKEIPTRSPLLELNIGKDEVRKMAHERGLPNWDHPACACLASRVPYGEEITPERLRKIAAAERAIKELGYKVVRVRDHNTLARIELTPNDISSVLNEQVRAKIVSVCKSAGYTYVCIDLEGYRMGSFNQLLENSENK